MLVQIVRLLLFTCFGLGISSATLTLQQIAVLHRHGARTPIGIINGSLICSEPYCQLTSVGKDMCRSLGKYIANNYRPPLGLPLAYNVSFISSESTDFMRVVVSAEAMLLGLYEGSVLPFVDFVPRDVDTRLCMWNSWPTWKIRATYEAELHSLDVELMTQIGSSNLTKIGEAFGLQELCASDPMDCIAWVQDTINCNISQGNPVPQWLVELHPTMKSLCASFLGRLLGYWPSEEYSSNIGSLGFPYVTSVLEWFASASPAKVFHSAAHDWTLIAVYSALGIWSPSIAHDPTFVPLFAETLILEKFVEDDGSAFIKARRGYPEQQAGSNYSFQFNDVSISCISKNGTKYTSLNTSRKACPIADLWRFVNTTAPKSPDNICYATQEMLETQRCDVNDAPEVGSRCFFYRKYCPMQSCGTQDPNAVSDPSRGYMCQTLQLNKDTPYLTATIIALVAPALLAGAIIGFYGGGAILNRIFLHKNEEFRPISSSL